jgi:hypothetical protein
MLDDLRRDDGDFSDDLGDDNNEFVAEEQAAAKGDTKFLGMSAAERMLVSMFIFLCVLIAGLIALVYTGRIAI